MRSWCHSCGWYTPVEHSESRWTTCTRIMNQFTHAVLVSDICVEAVALHLHRAMLFSCCLRAHCGALTTGERPGLSKRQFTRDGKQAILEIYAAMQMLRGLRHVAVVTNSWWSKNGNGHCSNAWNKTSQGRTKKQNMHLKPQRQSRCALVWGSSATQPRIYVTRQCKAAFTVCLHR